MELRVNNVSKSYVKKIGFMRRGTHSNKEVVKKALNNVSFTLTEGTYGLMGPNGAGKTTLMNLIVGNLKSDTGNIFLNDENIHKMGANYRERIGYMPQQQWMYENMSCTQFLSYMGALKGMSGKEGSKRIEEVLDLVNLTSEKSKKIGALSGGMKQRLLIAQAILNDPDILILDEPTAGVDPNERIRIRNLISQISFNKIVIIATHVVSDIEFISNEFMLLKEGNLIYKETHEDLVSKMDGKVWECKVTEEQMPELEKKYQIVSLMKEMDMIKARIVTDNYQDEYQATAVIPTLEDLYLNLYGA